MSGPSAPFVFVDQAELHGDTARLRPDDDHHLRRVLRLSAGAPLVVCDGRGRVWEARLAAAGVAELAGTPVMHAPQWPRLHVLQALPKGRKLDEALQALVELGVDQVTPVEAERSVVRLAADRRERARTRWEAVARAAAGQSRRPWLPRVGGVVDVATAAEDLARSGACGVVAHVGAPTPLAEALARLPEGAEEVAVAVGPEGGWTRDEVERWERGGLIPATLGPSVLRTEHAAFAACAAISYAVGRMA